jgi:alkylation response protein AidB-like acyl-CoA dehydrogenase
VTSLGDRTAARDTLSDAEKRALVDVAADFARAEIAPRVADYDREERLPRDLLERMAELGFFGGVVPPRYGGLGMDFPTFARFVEEISKVCQAMATLVTMPSGLVGAAIEGFGTDEQKEECLRPIAEGHAFGAAAVTEPRSGSDVAGMDTTYRTDGADFVLHGAKAWISNLDIADFFVTFGTRDRSLRHRGVSAFIVPRDSPGVMTRPYKNKLGFRPLSTGDVFFDEVRLPPAALLGEEGDGFRVAMTAVERGRLGVAARSVGLGQACLDDAVAYAQERRAFDQSIAEFQLVQSKICDMVVGVETARLLVRSLAEALDGGSRARRLTSMAKLYASDIAARCAADAVQIHGAYGVSPEYRVGRMYRDAKVLQIVEGANDIHRALIGEITLGLRSSGEPTLS